MDIDRFLDGFTEKQFLGTMVLIVVSNNNNNVCVCVQKQMWMEVEGVEGGGRFLGIVLPQYMVLCVGRAYR